MNKVKEELVKYGVKIAQAGLSTVPQARTWLLNLIERSDTHPLPVSKTDTVTQSMLYDAIYNLLIQPRGWPDLDQVLTGLRHGNAQPALETSGEKDTDPPISITNAAPLCLDLPDHRDARQVMTDAQHAEERDPVFAGGYFAGPYTWSQSLATQLSSGRLLTFDGYGHGAVVASTCARSTESSYLVNGDLPAIATDCHS